VGLLLVPTLLACGLINNAVNKAVDSATGGENFKPAAALWSDVPPMDGLTPGQLQDLPLPIKLLVRTILGNLGRLNAPGEDQTTGNIDWISYDHAGTPQDVAAFYTADLMASNGWAQTEGSGCSTASADGVPQGGVFCVFTKEGGGTTTQLAIIATQEDASKPTGVFFLRLEEATATPTP
ncbi:MAG TPA: hypothetical protein VIU38_09005, partial [Anaerolineales bacterium]